MKGDAPRYQNVTGKGARQQCAQIVGKDRKPGSERKILCTRDEVLAIDGAIAACGVKDGAPVWEQIYKRWA